MKCSRQACWLQVVRSREIDQTEFQRTEEELTLRSESMLTAEIGAAQSDRRLPICLRLLAAASHAAPW